jgi:hypothetical protein
MSTELSIILWELHMNCYGGMYAEGNLRGFKYIYRGIERNLNIYTVALKGFKNIYTVTFKGI